MLAARPAMVADLSELLELMVAFNDLEHITWNKVAGEPARINACARLIRGPR